MKATQALNASPPSKALKNGKGAAAHRQTVTQTPHPKAKGTTSGSLVLPSCEARAASHFTEPTSQQECCESKARWEQAYETI